MTTPIYNNSNYDSTGVYSEISSEKNAERIEENKSNKYLDDKVSQIAAASDAFALRNSQAQNPLKPKITNFPANPINSSTVSQIIFHKESIPLNHGQPNSSEVTSDENSSAANQPKLKSDLPITYKTGYKFTDKSNRSKPSIWPEKPTQTEVNIFLDLVSSKCKIKLKADLKTLLYERLDIVEVDRGTLAIMYNILKRFHLIKQPSIAIELYFDIAAAAYWACSHQDDTSYNFKDFALTFGVERFEEFARYDTALKSLHILEHSQASLNSLLNELNPIHKNEIEICKKQIETTQKHIDQNLSFARVPVIVLRKHFNQMFAVLEAKAIGSMDQNNLNEAPNLTKDTESVLNDYGKEIYGPARPQKACSHDDSHPQIAQNNRS
jgi:hypothetical protein